MAINQVVERNLQEQITLCYTGTDKKEKKTGIHETRIYIGG
jgi:hypothetical protein